MSTATLTPPREQDATPVSAARRIKAALAAFETVLVHENESGELEILVIDSRFRGSYMLRSRRVEQRLAKLPTPIHRLVSKLVLVTPHEWKGRGKHKPRDIVISQIIENFKQTMPLEVWRQLRRQHLVRKNERPREITA